MAQKEPKTRHSVRALLAALLLALIVSLGTACHKEPLPIALIAPLRGQGATIGLEARDSMQLAVEQINASEGICGQSIRLHIFDSTQGIEHLRTQLQTFIDNGGLGLVGPLLSSHLVELADLLNERQLTTITPTASTPLLAGQDDFIFRLRPDAHVVTAVLARNMADRGFERYSIVRDMRNPDFSAPWAQSLQSQADSLGLHLVRDVPYGAEADPDFRGIARSLAESPPQALVMIAPPVDAAMLTQHLQRTPAADAALYAAEWAAREAFFQYAGKYGDRVEFISAFDMTSSAPAYREFTRLFEERYHYPSGFIAGQTRDALGILLQGLQRTGTQGGDALRQAIRNARDLQGLQGPIEFNSSGDVIATPVVRDLSSHFRERIDHE